MNRRTVLRLLAIGGPGATTLPEWGSRLAERAFAQAAPPAHVGAPWTPSALSPRQNETVVAISELIIPQTETAGAKAARVNEFIDAVIADADPPERTSFLNGLAWMDTHARELHGADFVALAPPQQVAILEQLSAPGAPASAGVNFFKSIKALAITGYYTSKVGMHEELEDDGRTGFPDYVGCTHPEHKAGV